MAQQNLSTIENNFTGGLKTENNPLNFPENACTDTDNCIFTVTGNVVRRNGIDIDPNGSVATTDKTNDSLASFVWNNAGGDGNSVLYVVHIGNTLYFYKQYAATNAAPLSSQLLGSTVFLPTFSSGSAVQAGSFECQFADGNGHLFVFHPALNPFYVDYDPLTDLLSAKQINMQVRDLQGLFEPGLPDNFRPAALTNEHYYNLLNQGWTNKAQWSTSSTTAITLTNTNITFTVSAGLVLTVGDVATVSGLVTTAGGVGFAFPDSVSLSASVFSYSGTTLVLTFSSIPSNLINATGNSWSIFKASRGLIDTWQLATSNYPSNADVWWNFKNSSDVFDPATRVANTTLAQSPAPKGSAIFNAFLFDRGGFAGTGFITSQGTLVRPRTGTWFQGRLWYAGVDASVAAVGDTTPYSWSENIYFSQIIEDVSDFGNCFQKNDPTSQDLFDLLPSDGGIIKIQGCGSVYKLFPIQNGLLVFADKGIWFVTGSKGIGFTADDYTVTKISSVRSISGCSFISVLGLPVFWNEEGIYSVVPGQNGGLEVNNLCLGTIATFYNGIPLQSKKFARGDYDPIAFVMSWVFKSTNETSIGDRYNFNRVLSFNTATKAFYPYTLNNAFPFIADVKYVVGSGGTFPESKFQYLTFFSTVKMTFCSENDATNWKDFVSLENRFGVPGRSFDYNSFFISGYRLHGQALTKFQPIYLLLFSDADIPTAYKISGIWDFASSGNSGKYSSVQVINNNFTNFGVVYRRHKIRGHGLSLQFKVQSVQGEPFNIFGWSTMETKNASV